MYILYYRRSQEQCTQELFDAIVDRSSELGYNLQVQTVVSDFEDAVLRAVSASFGREVDSKGCFYHLTQSTWRKIQEIGLTQHYHSNQGVRLFCGMLDGLAVLPTNEVLEGMVYLKTISPPEAEKLVDYFDTTYVFGGYRSRQLEDSQGVRLRLVPPICLECP